MKIYTKTGDKGTTRLVDGSCVAKHDPRVEAYGTVDELNSSVGVILANLGATETALVTERMTLQRIQHHLFRVGSLVATEKPDIFHSLPQIDESHIEFLENAIDRMTEKLPPLKSFILPAGTPSVTSAHVARTICRRSERRVSEIYADADLSAPPLQNVLIYLNRLSDYFFTLARFDALNSGYADVPWDKNL